VENLFIFIKFDRNVKQIRSLNEKRKIYFFLNVWPLYFPTYLVYFLYNILCFHFLKFCPFLCVLISELGSR
jgi:hypothetical protein